MRFMQTNIIVLPVDPHGPLRTLHERIATSGLRFARPRFMYSPHCTLSFYQTMTPEMQRRILSVHVDAPVIIDRLQFYYSLDPQPARKVLELALGASGAAV
jgi:2'-5' RNA ligase